MPIVLDPIAAVTHPDPYPYYASLVAEAPLYRDEPRGLWVASGAAHVTAVLTSERCRVRPAAEPVPAALVGSPAGDVFARLVRMNDGPPHEMAKPAVATALHGLDTGGMVDRARVAARRLAAELEPAAAPTHLRDFALHLPVYVVAGLLGVRDEDLPATAGWTGDFAAGLAPGASTEGVARASSAAGHLRDVLRARVAGHAGTERGLFGALLEAARQARVDAGTVDANAIGFLFQSYEATAALIANTLSALGAHPESRPRAVGDLAALRAVVREVARWDAPVQNTRRFVAKAGIVSGQLMKEGDVILVLLAAANRDSAVNAEPHRFDVTRSAPVTLTFGIGPHACPGEALATAIATAGVHELLAAGVEPAALGPPAGYRRSVNVRMALWGTP
jgi:cytochrome P450